MLKGSAVIALNSLIPLVFTVVSFTMLISFLIHVSVNTHVSIDFSL